MKKIKLFAAALFTAAVMTLSCGCSKESKVSGGTKMDVSYADIVLGETGLNLNTTIKFINHKTDMVSDDYPGVNWKEYLAEFNKIYPGIKVEIETITNYADQALLRLQGGNWGDIMMIPALDKKDVPEYFLSYGSLEILKNQIRFADTWMVNNQVYGVPYMANAQGVLYNKKVFEQAGITKIPVTPEEFIAALKLIKKNTSAIPLYTNYAAGWTMGAWDAYIGGTATGKSEYQNNLMLHEKNPFRKYDDGTHAYAVYKVLYDAVSEGLIEEDYTTTDWEGCKGMLNRGEIGTMVLGSWAYTQMQGAGPNPDDIGYMSFPITIDGKQYASSGADYSYGINVKSSADNQLASMILVKWFTEKSGFSYNEGGIPVSASDSKYPSVYQAFDGIDFVPDSPAVAGEEDLLNKLNSDSELNINAGGNKKVQEIIEHAANHDMDFDAIMDSWNQAWTAAQKRNNVQVR